MSASTHSPAPWSVAERPCSVEGVSIAWSIFSRERSCIADGQAQEHLGDTGIHEEECRANAHLMSAAPDMLAALQALDQHGHTPMVWEQAKRAMAKAVGGAA